MELVLKIVLFMLSASSITLAQQVQSSYLSPNPTKDSLLCGHDRRVKSYVCDQYRLLTKKQVDQLDKLLLSVVDDTSCPCSSYSCKTNRQGYKIGIALIKKLPTDNKQTAGREKQSKSDYVLDLARQFALNIHSNWNLGFCDEDIIILYSENDDLVYTVTGGVARKKLTDEHVKHIQLKARRNAFHSGIFNGLSELVVEYKSILMGDVYSIPQPSRLSGARVYTSPYTVSLVGLFALTALTINSFSCSM